MMEQTRIYKALQGVRGRKPVDLAALESLLVRFSRLVIENPRIKEADINPLMAGPEQLLALDARFVLHPAETADSELPRPAIRPYPVQYVSSWKMKDGTSATIRPIRPEDEPALVKFHQSLSERSVYFRYFHAAKLSQRIAHERLTRVCFLDYDRDIALLAEAATEPQGREILGIARMSKSHGHDTAEVAVLISDKFQRRGLGIELLRRLLDVARDEHLDGVHAYILDENVEMQTLMRKVGFSVAPTDDPTVLYAALSLKSA
jgi:acetyltransferase